MTRQNKLIVLIAYLLVLMVFMLLYRSNRTKKVKSLHADIARITSEQDKTRAVEADVTRLIRLIPTEGNTPAFIETLYLNAKESGLTQHEVSTEADKNSASARPGGSDTTGAITKQRLKVSANGSYKSFAEYIRRLQNLERLSRIIDFKLTPDAAQLKGNLTVELCSVPVTR